MLVRSDGHRIATGIELPSGYRDLPDAHIVVLAAAEPLVDSELDCLTGVRADGVLRGRPVDGVVGDNVIECSTSLKLVP